MTRPFLSMGPYKTKAQFLLASSCSFGGSVSHPMSVPFSGSLTFTPRATARHSTSVATGSTMVATFFGASVSPGPTWTNVPLFTVQDGVIATESLPVSAGGSPITMSWVSPGSQPSWVSFSSPQASPTISFNGTQVDANDVASMVLRATANAVPADSPAGSITVTAPPSWSQPPPITITSLNPTHNYSQYVSNYNDYWDIIRNTGGDTLNANTTLADDDGLVEFDDQGVYETKSNIIFEIVPSVQADWLARSAGAFFAENFDYTDLTQAANHVANPRFYGLSGGTNSAGQSTPNTSIYGLITDPTIALSGKALRIHRLPESGSSAATWLYTWDPNGGIQINKPLNMTLRPNYYFQFIVSGDVFFNWPWLLSGNPNGGSGQFSSPKVVQLGRADSSTIAGELVIIDADCMGFVNMYIRGTPETNNPNSTTLFQRSQNSPQQTPDFRRQGSADAGVPNPATTMQQLRQRYGPWGSDILGGSAYPVINGSTRLTDNATFVTELAEASVGGIPWKRYPDRMVVEVRRTITPSPRVQIWGARYGDVARVIADSQDLGWGLGWLSSLTNQTTDVGNGFELSTYVTGDINAAGANQPDTWVDYIELIGSDNPIPFPLQLGVSLP